MVWLHRFTLWPRVLSVSAEWPGGGDRFCDVQDSGGGNDFHKQRLLLYQSKARAPGNVFGV